MYVSRCTCTPTLHECISSYMYKSVKNISHHSLNNVHATSEPPSVQFGAVLGRLYCFGGENILPS